MGKTDVVFHFNFKISNKHYVSFDQITDVVLPVQQSINYFWNESLRLVSGLNRGGGWLYDVGWVIDVMFENIQHCLDQRQFWSRR